MFSCEAEVWAYLKPRLDSSWWWQRMEVRQPDGFPDVLGLRGIESRFIEMKCGPPRMSSLRKSQKRWLSMAMARNLPVFVVFGTKDGLVWFRTFPLAERCEPPEFFSERPQFSLESKRSRAYIPSPLATGEHDSGNQ